MTGLLIGGTASGVGKTTVTLAIIACLRRRGYVVQPCKGGPDFLDTTHHSRIAGRKARNLDTWMLSPQSNREVLSWAAAGADAVVVEGMMGLFDGKDGVTETGSSAEIAKMLKLPVLLVLDCAKSARSVAATVLGFECFDPDLPLAGLILNRVAGLHHRRLLESAFDDLLKLEFPLETIVSPDTEKGGSPHVRIGVARDQAFSFYYEDNLDLLREQGAEISDCEVATSYQVDFSLSGKQQREGFTRGNVLASYVHLHFGANPVVARHFVGAIRQREAATA